MPHRAPSMDYVGAHYAIPFADSAGSMWSLPLPRSTIKLVVYAGVSRGAYYLAAGKRDSAELSLRQIVSMGFSIADNANSLIEALLGIIVSGIGRQGLIDYYTAIGDPRARTLEARRDSVIAVLDLRAAQQGPKGTWDDDLDWRDPSVARARTIATRRAAYGRRC